MDAKELRIGNLINVGGCTIDTYQIYTPCVVNIGMLKQIQEENKERPDAILSVWQPIPLIEEWMLKFGARKVNHINGYSFWTFHNTKLNNFCLDIYEKRTEYYSRTIKHIKYVHQLQNLYFALTGTELEIINS